MVESEKYPLRSKASLSELRRLVRADLNGAGWDPSLAFDCLVAVTEACTNALLHGQRVEADEPDPCVSWAIDEQAARFCVEDFSTEMWSKAAHPASGVIDLGDGRAGGFGLGLMRSLMDDVRIEIGPRGTTVSMVKRCSDAPVTRPLRP